MLFLRLLGALFSFAGFRQAVVRLQLSLLLPMHLAWVEIRGRFASGFLASILRPSATAPPAGYCSLLLFLRAGLLLRRVLCCLRFGVCFSLRAPARFLSVRFYPRPMLVAFTITFFATICPVLVTFALCSVVLVIVTEGGRADSARGPSPRGVPATPARWPLVRAACRPLHQRLAAHCRTCR